MRKAIIPLAGLGTRLLPATKAVPKGLLPVIDRPVVQYVAEEAAAAGLTDIVLVTGEGQEAFGTWAASSDMPVTFVTQDPPRGLGDAVLRCADYVGAEPFAVLFGDNILIDGAGLLTEMIAARQKYGGTILALIEIPAGEASARCVATVERDADPGVVRVTDLVEKPERSGGQSRWIMIGRCVCDPAIFGVLRDTPPGRGGEIQLSDALRALAQADLAAGGGVRGLLFRGRRLDTGNKQDYLRATIEMACSRPDIADEFLPWLRRYVSSQGDLQFMIAEASCPARGRA